MRLNVLLMIPSLHQGGSERQGIRLAQLLSGTGRYRVTFACLDRTGALLPEAESLALGEIPEFRLNSFYDRNMLTQLRRSVKLLETQAIDVVQTFDFYTNVFVLTAATLARVPLRVGARRETAGHRTAAQKWIERHAFLLSHVIVANSEAVRQELIGDGVRASKVVTVYNAADINPLMPSILSDRAGLLRSLGLPTDPGHRFIAIVANLQSPYKDHPTFLRAAQLVNQAVPEATFVLAGEGPLIEEMRLLAHQLGIGQRTFFPGRCMQVPQLLSLSEVCVLSSKSGEGFSNAILEYMAAARPVVATDVGGAREAVADGESGWIVRPGDHSAMATRIIELLRNPQRALEMGQRGRRIIEEKFAPEASLARIESLYRELLPKRARAEVKEPREAISHLETIE